MENKNSTNKTNPDETGFGKADRQPFSSENWNLPFVTEKHELLSWQSCRIRLTDNYAIPPEMMSINGSTVGTLGNFSASAGKAKSKKTFNLSAIVAAALSQKEILKYRVTLPPEKSRILYIDTEQSSYHCHKVLERIYKMAGLPMDKESGRLEFLMLRAFGPVQRKQFIETALLSLKDVGLVIIDGIRDLMYDINSPSESVDLINLLMKWSSDFNIHIHTVLHMNKGDENTRGHIGTELNNKAETVLKVSKSLEDPNISEVRAMHIRDREFEPFAFRINEESLPELVQDYSANTAARKKLQFTDLSEELHRTALEYGFGDNAPVGYPQMIDALKNGYASIGYTRGRNTLIKLSKYLMQNDAIVKFGANYKYNPDFELHDTSGE